MRRKKLIFVLVILFSTTWFSACQNYNDLYGSGSNKNDKSKKSECLVASSLYVNCANMNPGSYGTACSSEYYLAAGLCGGGAGGGGGGGGGGY